MTANTATKTETNTDDAPAVDVEVVSSDSANDTVTTRDDQTVKAELVAKQTVTLDNLKRDHAQALETNGHYHDWGFAYAAPAPIANAIGAELGFMQRDNETMTVQRTGIGFYLRSDHVSDVKFNACTTRI
jgi:serine protease inhibitor ecotin